MVETVAQALDDLCEELVFVGGCAAGLLCTSPSAAPPRVTYDVDVVAEVVALAAIMRWKKNLRLAVLCGICRRMRLSAAGVLARWKSI
jgi:hypothetical protein